jgi:hypothetical protein
LINEWRSPLQHQNLFGNCEHAPSKAKLFVLSLMISH